MADLGPGTMPRGKYPESPAPAGSHALISRTPTPGGMLHANLGPPRPTPRNFQPPLPRFPSRLSPRRMSGTTAGRILSHSLPRPTPTPAASARTQAQLPSLIPRAAAPAAACVPGRSTGQHMLPQQALKINGNNAPHKTKNPSCRHSVAACVSDHSRGCERISPRHRSNPQRKKTVVIPEFSAWLTFVLERCHAENIRNLPRQRAPTPLFPERRPREACSMPISGRHDLPLATFNLPSRVFRHGCRRAECLERRRGGFFHTLSRGQRPLR